MTRAVACITSALPVHYQCITSAVSTAIPTHCQFIVHCGSSKWLAPIDTASTVLYRADRQLFLACTREEQCFTGQTDSSYLHVLERNDALQGRRTALTCMHQRGTMLQGKPMAEHGERGLVGWGREGVVMTHLVRVICRLCSTTGWKLRILGYRSIGLRVPEVMITLWNLANTGFTAKLASRQLSYRAQHSVGSLRKAREEKRTTCNRCQCMCNTVSLRTGCRCRNRHAGSRLLSLVWEQKTESMCMLQYRGASLYGPCGCRFTEVQTLWRSE